MKRGQLKLSFGMIFSIILIILFISFAFYAISKFLNLQTSVTIGKFINEFQSDINKIWKGSQGSQQVEYFLPKKIKYICFADYNYKESGENKNLYNTLKKVYWEEENLFFYPVGSGDGLDSKNVLHIDLEQTTQTLNPICFQNVDGKVKMTIKKDFGEKLVTITD